MGFKAIIMVGLLMAILLQITSFVAARELLAETATSKTNTDAASEAYQVDGRGGYNRRGGGGHVEAYQVDGRGGYNRGGGGHGEAYQVDGRGGYNKGRGGRG